MRLDVDLSSLTVEEIRTWVQAAITYNCILMPIDKRTYRTEKKSLIAPDGFTKQERIMMWCLDQEVAKSNLFPFIQSDDDEEDEEKEIPEEEIVKAKRSFRKKKKLKVATNRWFSYPTKGEIIMIMCRQDTLEHTFELAKRSFRKNKKSVLAADRWCSINLTKRESMMLGLDIDEANQFEDDEEEIIDKEILMSNRSITKEKEPLVAEDDGCAYLKPTKNEIRMMMVEGFVEAQTSFRITKQEIRMMMVEESVDVEAKRSFRKKKKTKVAMNRWFSYLTNREMKMMMCEKINEEEIRMMMCERITEEEIRMLMCERIPEEEIRMMMCDRMFEEELVELRSMELRRVDQTKRSISQKKNSLEASSQSTKRVEEKSLEAADQLTKRIMMMRETKIEEDMVELAKRSIRKKKKSLIGVDRWFLYPTKKEIMMMLELDQVKVQANQFIPTDDEQEIFEEEM